MTIQTNAASETKSKAPKTDAGPEIHWIGVTKRDGRYVTMTARSRGGRFTESPKQVADNHGLEGLILDATIKFRRVIADAFNPLVKRADPK